MVGVSTHGMNGSSDQSFHGGPIELFLISAMTGVTKGSKTSKTASIPVSGCRILFWSYLVHRPLPLGCPNNNCY